MTTHKYEHAFVRSWQEKVNKLLERWDDLMTHLTNNGVAQQDLENLHILWKDSENYLTFHCVQFDLIGDRVEGYSGSVYFFDTSRLERFIDLDGDENDQRNAEFLMKHPHTLKIIF